MVHLATISSKGQITIPAALRSLWQLKEGDKLEFYVDADGRLFVRPLNAAPTAVFESYEDHPMKSYTDTDDEAITKAVVAKNRRSKARRRAA